MEVAPYLSVVATARNDDHGGNLLGRMQAFVSGWIAQSNRYRLSSELIIVEWNPTPDRPRLREALQWPEQRTYCDVRLLEVSPELHRRYRHGDALPLYQMIAKNAGIRRARGRFILATNIDILFSDELVAFLAERRLECGRMYRIDRHDVDAGVPDGTIESQLEYCRNHLLRINTREGTFPVSRDVLKAPRADITVSESGIRFGGGWYPPEQHTGSGLFRWARHEAEIYLNPPPRQKPDRDVFLSIDLEPGPGMAQQPLSLELLENGIALGSARMERRSKLRIAFPAATTEQKLLFRVHGGGHVLDQDPRVLNFRVFSCQWGSGREMKGLSGRGRRWKIEPMGLWRRALNFRNDLGILAERLIEDGPIATFTVAVSAPMKRAAAAYIRLARLTGMPPLALRIPTATAESSWPQDAGHPPLLHTNACGDFTLLSREDWFALRAYPEFDVFSMNLDSVFCFAAHFGGAPEEMLEEPMRIYHIEHGTGSGWTPEGEMLLYERLKQKGLPWLTSQEVMGWAAHMWRLNSPMIFNRDNWGLADHSLAETHP